MYMYMCVYVYMYSPLARPPAQAPAARWPPAASLAASRRPPATSCATSSPAGRLGGTTKQILSTHSVQKENTMCFVCTTCVYIAASHMKG